ncbi:MAG: copper homeostasis protein CutC [Bacteroidota bacterium]
MKYTLEICCDSITSVDAAIAGGAHRIELCTALSVGGLTPSAALIEKSIERNKVPVFVLIRPRIGDFIYSEAEKEILFRDIVHARSLGVAGIVSGALNADGSIDEETSRQIVRLASPLPCTFHRAFDYVKDFSASLEIIINCGFQRILTSGGAATAFDGIQILKELNQKANNRIHILAGGGINDKNIAGIATETDISEFHASAKITFSGNATYKESNTLISAPNLTDESDYFLTDTAQVEALLKSLDAV